MHVGRRDDDGPEARDRRLQTTLDAFAVPDLQRRVGPRTEGSCAHYDLIHRGTRKLPLPTRAPHAAAWYQGTAAPDVVFEHRLLRAMPRSEYLSHFVSRLCKH